MNKKEEYELIAYIMSKDRTAEELSNLKRILQMILDKREDTSNKGDNKNEN